MQRADQLQPPLFFPAFATDLIKLVDDKNAKKRKCKKIFDALDLPSNPFHAKVK